MFQTTMCVRPLEKTWLQSIPFKTRGIKQIHFSQWKSLQKLDPLLDGASLKKTEAHGKNKKKTSAPPQKKIKSPLMQNNHLTRGNYLHVRKASRRKKKKDPFQPMEAELIPCWVLARSLRWARQLSGGAPDGPGHAGDVQGADGQGLRFELKRRAEKTRQARFCVW